MNSNKVPDYESDEEVVNRKNEITQSKVKRQSKKVEARKNIELSIEL